MLDVAGRVLTKKARGTRLRADRFPTNALGFAALSRFDTACNRGRYGTQPPSPTFIGRMDELPGLQWA